MRLSKREVVILYAFVILLIIGGAFLWIRSIHMDNEEIRTEITEAKRIKVEETSTKTKVNENVEKYQALLKVKEMTEGYFDTEKFEPEGATRAYYMSRRDDVAEYARDYILLGTDFGLDTWNNMSIETGQMWGDEEDSGPSLCYSTITLTFGVVNGKSDTILDIARIIDNIQAINHKGVFFSNMDGSLVWSGQNVGQSSIVQFTPENVLVQGTLQVWVFYRADV